MGRLFLLLKQKLWCNTCRNAALQLVDKFAKTKLTFSRPPQRTERRHPVYQSNRRKWKTSFSRLFGRWRQQRTTNELCYDTYWATLKTGMNPTTGREQLATSNTPTARLRTLVRLAETLTRNWHQQSHHCTSSTHKPQPWLGHCPMLKLQYELFSMTDSESWYTKWEQTPVNRCQQLPAPDKRLRLSKR